MRGAIQPLPPYTFMAWCSFRKNKHRDNFTLFYIKEDEMGEVCSTLRRDDKYI